LEAERPVFPECQSIDGYLYGHMKQCADAEAIEKRISLSAGVNVGL
jgi:hypothetical protein